MPKNVFDQLDFADCVGHPEVASQNALTRTQAGQQGKVREVRLDTPILSHCIRDACLRIGHVAAIVGLSVPTIYREIANGRFPRPIKLTPGARAWKMSDVMHWIDSRERDGCEPGCAKTSAVNENSNSSPAVPIGRKKQHGVSGAPL